MKFNKNNKKFPKRNLISFIKLKMTFDNFECNNCKFINPTFNKKCIFCKTELCEMCRNKNHSFCSRKTHVIAVFCLFIIIICYLKSYSYSILTFSNLLFAYNYLDYYYNFAEHEIYYELKLLLKKLNNFSVIICYIIYFSIILFYNSLFELIFIISIFQILIMQISNLYPFIIPEMYLIYFEYLLKTLRGEDKILHLSYGLLRLFLINNYFLTLISRY